MKCIEEALKKYFFFFTNDIRNHRSNFTYYFSEMIDPTNSNIKNSKDLAENLSLTAFLYYLLSDCIRRQR